MDNEQIVEEKRKGWKELMAAGVPKGTGVTAYESALNTKFYRASCFLQEKLDEDCFHLMHYLRKNNFEQESNWCANNVLAKSKFHFIHAVFCVSSTNQLCNYTI